MKIAFVTSEALPFVKTGGLADVSNPLPRALAKLGHDARIFMPRYSAIDRARFPTTKLIPPLHVPLGFGEKLGAIHESDAIPGVSTYFIEHNMYFDRDGLYDDGFDEYADNAERFAFFSRAVIQTLKLIKFKPDIIHCNDWQTGLMPVFLKTHYAADPFFKNTSSIFTVHNVGYQGVFHKDNIVHTQLGWDMFTIDGLEYYDEINYMKGGILFADAVTTVSKQYAREIQTEEFGYRLAPVFKKIKKRLYGITNGVDYQKWDPSKDRLIPKKFSPGKMSGKKICKHELQKTMGLSENPEIPIISIISRLTWQKGVDVLCDTLFSLLAKDKFQFMILGSGENGLIDRYEQLREMFPKRVGVYWGYNEQLSHLIEAGSDIYIMPSRFEPCGLNQMYSMKYGTIPIVRKTGGMDDTVTAWNPDTMTGNGFKFGTLSPATLARTIREVLSLFREQDKWKVIQKNAMKFNYTWDDAAGEYEKVYKLL